MKYLRPFLISLILVVIALNTPAHYWSVDYWKGFFNPNFGVSYTTISSTDTVSNFPTVYNNNNAAFDAGKIEVGTTSVASITTLGNLSTVGTITSGALGTGFSTIDCAEGGTGTTTPTLNQIMIGNGASCFKVIGFGGSGQFLTSQGSGSAPQWTTAAVDTAANYVWTGFHQFSNLGAINATSTNATTTSFAISGSALHLNGVDYRLPSADGASSTPLTTDGNGNLLFITPEVSTLHVDGTHNTSTGGTVEETVVIPANFLNTSTSLRILLNTTEVDGGTGNMSFTLDIGDGSATSTIASFTGGGTGDRLIDGHISVQGASSQDAVFWRDNGNKTATDISLNTSSQLYIIATATAGNGADVVGIEGFDVIVYKN